MPRPRRKHRRNSRPVPDPLPDPFQVIIDSDVSSVPSSVADDYITNLLNHSDTEFPSPSNSPKTRSPKSKSPTKRSSKPNSRNTRSRKSPSPSRRSSKSRSSTSSSSRSPQRARKPQPRQIVMDDCITAFTKFAQRNSGSTTHSCQPTPDSRHRLALHRSAELMGASSSSMGNGKDRCVIMKWPPGKRVPISEAAFERGVTRILDELLPEKRVMPTGGRERQRAFARQMRISRIWSGEVDDSDVDRHDVDDHDDNHHDGGDVRGGGDVKGHAAVEPNGEKKVGRGNIGFDILEKMGWSEGTGLGAERDGRVDPIVGERRMKRAGLGSI